MKTKLLSILLLAAMQAISQSPVLHWKLANPVIYDNAGITLFEFDVMVSCDMAGTYHHELNLVFGYNVFAWGDNISGYGVISCQPLELLEGDLGGTPLYNTSGPVDIDSGKCSFGSVATFTIANPMFMNEIPHLPSYGGFVKIILIVGNQDQLAGISFIGAEGGTSYMNGGQFYVGLGAMTPTKYGIPPLYEGVYENDLINFPLSCCTAAYWTGQADDDWFNPANWAMNLPDGLETRIGNVSPRPFPVIANGQTEVLNLVVAPQVSVTILPGGGLTCSNLLTNHGAIDIRSAPSGESGSFITLSSRVGNGLFSYSRHITNTAPPGDPAGWHYLSSPVEGFGTDDIPDYYVNLWSEPQGVWTHVEGATPACVPAPNVVLAPTGAFSVKFDENYSCPGGTGLEIEFVSPVQGLRTDNYTAQLQHTAASPFAGWNFTGNPYPSAVDPALLGWGAATDQSVYFWDGENNVYVAWAGGIGPKIPPTQGFFVHANAPDQLIFSNGARVHDLGQQWFKQEMSGVLIIRSKGNGMTDRTFIRLLDEATEGFDSRWDAYKLKSPVASAPQVFTSLRDVDYAINTINEIQKLALGFQCGKEGIYQVSVESSGDFETVFLEDKTLNHFHDLAVPYLFAAGASEQPGRFLLHFSLPAEAEKTGSFGIYSTGKTVYVVNRSGRQGEVAVTNITGQQIAAQTLENGLNLLQVNGGSGLYLVSVISGSETVSKKVFLQ